MRNPEIFGVPHTQKVQILFLQPIDKSQNMVYNIYALGNIWKFPIGHQSMFGFNSRYFHHLSLSVCCVFGLCWRPLFY